MSPLALALLGLVALIPASDLAVALVNRSVTDLLGPRPLPRLELRDDQSLRLLYRHGQGRPLHRYGHALLPGVSRRQARQIVRHGHIEVNGRKVNIPSYEVKAGDEIAVRENSRKVPTIVQALDYTSHQPAPLWLEINREALRGRVVAIPKREDINLPINEQLIVELYSK